MDVVDRFYEILHNHHMPACEARLILEYRSPNSLTRIVQRNVSQDLMLDFAERLIVHSKELHMTPLELAGVQESIQQLNLGLGNMTAYHTLVNVLKNEPAAEPAGPFSTALFTTRATSHPFTAEGITGLHCDILGICPSSFLQLAASLAEKAEV